ncbi:MAG: hypothetical protein KDA60_04165 [Planctomycetales bacterium]|nr:hypothetical protein [Planctomycetales bacterium]
MAKKQKKPDQGPSNAYLLSFGDTMTTLLAFFIVLNSLAEEQTGANLYRGTGSFVQAMESFGTSGRMTGERTQNAISKGEVSPLYAIEGEEKEEDQRGFSSGPDDEDDALRVINREEDEFERFMREMGRLSKVDQLPYTNGEAVFDFFEPLASEAPLVTGKYAEVVDQCLPLLYRPNYQIEVIVWATTPSPTAWRRAMRQSQQFGNEIAAKGNLPPPARGKVLPVGHPWIDSDVKRPVMSIIVKKS